MIACFRPKLLPPSLPGSTRESITPAGVDPRVKPEGDGKELPGGDGSSSPSCPDSIRASRGLFPRVRGNPPTCGCRARTWRPIPACAGQPVPRARPATSRRAYPRVCGATSGRDEHRGQDDGLSPRVRGNLLDRGGQKEQVRPIPACAGQPGSRRDHRHFQRAYPRVCGATLPAGIHDAAGKGLSPRVRGNLGLVKEGARLRGPIPACAGQPQRDRVGYRARPAYPRVCGATRTDIGGANTGMGLSPRVRGNQGPVRFEGLKRRPIPACAGQPDSVRLYARAREAYPRVCGATSRPG